MTDASDERGLAGEQLQAGSARALAAPAAPAAVPRQSAPGSTRTVSGRSASFERSWRSALVWIWHTLLSVTPSTWPISVSVRPS